MSPLLKKAATEFVANPTMENHSEFLFHLHLQWGMDEMKAYHDAKMWAFRCAPRVGTFRPVFDEDIKAARLYSEM